MSLMNTSLRFCTLALVLILCACVNAHADWPCRTDISVPVANVNGNQSNQRLCSDGKNGSIVVWQDRRSGVIDKLYAQRMSASGSPLWSDGGVALSGTDGYQYYPQIVSDGQGGAIVVWEDNR
jgi:hypothetical protein